MPILTLNLAGLKMGSSKSQRLQAAAFGKVATSVDFKKQATLAAFAFLDGGSQPSNPPLPK
jgi:hypothetical protein